jgi:hypothetical protein
MYLQCIYVELNKLFCLVKHDSLVSIIETQVMISVEIHAFNKIVFGQGSEALHREMFEYPMPQIIPFLFSVIICNQGLNNFDQLV